jgi:hypothetical protein
VGKSGGVAATGRESPSRLPPDPGPDRRNHLVPASFSEIWRYQHRGQLSALYHPSEQGWHPNFGFRPDKPAPVDLPTYYGWETQPVGRPPTHKSNADKQRAYRERKKAAKAKASGADIAGGLIAAASRTTMETLK